MNAQLRHFAASRRKVERAAKHFSDLAAEVESYLLRDPLKLEWQPVPMPPFFGELHSKDTLAVGLVARVREDVPLGLPEIIGDVVHNLRSALDILACDLVRAADPAYKLRKVSFPCWKSPDDRRRAIAGSHIEATGDRGVVERIDAWQPFRGGASRLYALSELDNLDKHRSIIPAMTGAIYSECNALFAHEVGANTIIDHFPVGRKVVDGQVMFIGPATMMPPTGTIVPATAGLAFDVDPTSDIEEIVGSEVLPLLNYLISIVSAVITSFESGVLPEFLPPSPREPVEVAHGVWTCPPEMSPEQVHGYFISRLEAKKVD